ncbi:MAG TPA: PPC domain-containing DNA-binding protein [Methanothrix sp.]|nr:PPC domain-containing DNA-binding protein [Methanothrix sp.]
MLIKDFRQGRIFFARLDHGADIISQIANLAEGNGIETCALSAIGALSRATLGYYDQVSQEYGKISADEPVELASCSGNISLRDDRPFVHAHAVLSDRTGRTWGGHLTCGTVFAVEVCLQELSGLPLKRVPDSITGLTLWGEE